MPDCEHMVTWSGAGRIHGSSLGADSLPAALNKEQLETHSSTTCAGVQWEIHRMYQCCVFTLHLPHLYHLDTHTPGSLSSPDPWSVPCDEGQDFMRDHTASHTATTSTSSRTSGTKFQRRAGPPRAPCPHQTAIGCRQQCTRLHFCSQMLVVKVAVSSLSSDGCEPICEWFKLVFEN